MRSEKPFDYVGSPWAHQLEALRLAEDKRDFALFFEPGCGKSYTAILIARRKMFHVERAMKTLVLCPPVVIDNWLNEWLTHSKIPKEKILRLKGTGKQRAEALMANPTATVVITNYESLLMGPVFGGLKSWGPEIFIADESHRVKNPSAKRTKKAAELAGVAKHRLLLSGTPIIQSPMDLFGQYLVLDQGDTFGKNFFEFRARYFYDRNAGMPPARHFPLWMIKPKAEEEISSTIKRTSISMKKSDCLDLPPLVKQSIGFELEGKQKRIYDEMAKDFITYVGSKACVAKMALTKALRLMQITSGFVTLEGDAGEDRTIVDLEDNPRIRSLGELFETLAPSGKILVWAAWRHNYMQIAKACVDADVGFTEIHGDVTAFNKAKNIETFKRSNEVRVLIGNPGSGGIGINLIEAPYSVFYSRSFSLEHDIQAEARNYRGGSEIHEKVTRYDLIAKDTIDEVIAARLAGKQAVSDKIVAELALEVEKTL